MRTILADYTVVIGDDKQVFLIDTSAGDIDIFLPYVIDIQALTFKKIDSTVNSITFHAKGNDLIENETSFVVAEAFDSISLTTNNDNKWWVLIGEDSDIESGETFSFFEEVPGVSMPVTAFKEVTGGLFPTAITWWKTSAKAAKVVEKTINRSAPASCLLPTPITWIIYETDGTTVKKTITDVVVYSGMVESTRTRTAT